MNVRRAARSLVPSGVRTARATRRLRAIGLIHLGNADDYQIRASTFGRGCRVNARVSIIGSAVGDHSYIETGARLHTTTVGKYTSIAPYALIGLAEHPLGAAVSTHPAFYLNRPEVGYDLVPETTRDEHSPTVIGHDVWVGAQTCIRTGVTVGHGAVVGAGSVVTKDVPPYAIVVGSPARVLRYRFEPEVIEDLLELAWWDRDDTWVRAHADAFHDIAVLRARLAGRDGQGDG